ISGSATTTSNVGVNISGGCFAVNDVCVGGGSGGGITSLGPAGQGQSGPTVTIATSTSAFNGLTPTLTITGSGNTLTYISSLSGSLGDSGIDNNITISGGTIGSNSISGTLTTTGTLTIGDGGDR